MTQLNISDSSIKLLQENIGINLHGLASGNEFLDITTKATKVKICTYISIHNGILFSCKKNEVLIHCIMWIYLENILLNWTVKTQRSRIVKFHLHEMSRIDKSV